MLAPLAAGATLNVAVAWAACVDPTWKSHSIDFHFNLNVQEFVDAGWSPTMSDWDAHTFVIKTRESWGVKSTGFMEQGFRPPPPGLHYDSQTGETAPIGSTLEAGWPLSALRGLWLRSSRSGVVTFSRNLSMPARPLWPGFAINTLFYAGVLWVLLAGPFALRRMIRKRRGRCAQCAYPIGQSPVCTECGAAISKHVAKN